MDFEDSYPRLPPSPQRLWRTGLSLSPFPGLRYFAPLGLPGASPPLAHAPFQKWELPIAVVWGTCSFLRPFRRFNLLQRPAGRQRLHLPDGDLVEPLEPAGLWQDHVSVTVQARPTFNYGEFAIINRFPLQTFAYFVCFAV